MVTTGPTHSSSISHCNSAGCNHDSRRPSAPPPPVPPEAADAAAGEDGDDDEDDDFIDEDNPLLLDQVRPSA